MSSEFDTLTKYILMIFKYYQHSEKLKIICIIFSVLGQICIHLLHNNTFTQSPWQVARVDFLHIQTTELKHLLKRKYHIFLIWYNFIPLQHCEPLSIALAGYNKYSNAICVADTNTCTILLYIYISVSHKIAYMDINTLSTDKI